ncbi:MAG: tetratricopeptide repeat protein [Bdellovibrionales bacterium]
MSLCKSILTLVVCLAVVLPLAGCDNPEQKEARYIKRGNALFEDGEYEKARIEYKNAAKLKPTEAEPFYRLGLIEEAMGDLRGAFSHFTAAEQQNSHFHPAVLKVAQYYMGAEQYEETRKRIDAVLGEAPDNAEAHATYAALLLREKKLDDAESEARTALTKEPANVSACAALVGVYSAKKDIDKAIKAVNEGIARNPKNIALLMLRVMVYGSANDLQKVAESYQAIFKLKPEATQFRTDLANIYVKANKLDEAEASLRAGIKDMPDNWDLKRRLVMFLSSHRGTEVAEKEIKDLMQVNPKNDDLYFWLADLYISNNAVDKAIEMLNEIVERGDYSTSALNARALLAGINIKRGNKDLADKLVAAVLTKEPDNRSALLVRASLSFEKGYYQNALTDLRSIIRNTPNDQAALQLMGETFLVQGHLDLAIDTMKKLVDVNPSNSAARVRLAQMVQMNGDIKQAMELVSAVTKATPDYPIGWEAAARIAIAAKEWLPAMEAIRTLDKMEGQHLTASYLEGLVLESNSKKEEAIAKYAEVINANPTTPLAEYALRSLVGTYYQLGRMEAATRYLETLKTDSPLVLTLLGKGYVSFGKVDEGAAVFDKLIEANAPVADPYLDRAGLYIKDHKPEQAIIVLKKGMNVVPSDLRMALVAAGLLNDAGKYQEAMALYDDMLIRNPGFEIAANNLAELIADTQYNDPDALEKARRTAERFSGSTNPLLLDTLAWVYFRQGNIPQAQTIMERAIGQGKDLPPQIHYHYGAILMKSGKIEKAKAELQQAVVEGVNYPGLEDAKKMLSTQ